MSDVKLDAPVFGHFEITRAKNAGNKPNPHGGELTKWYCGFEGEGHSFPDVYWQRKAGSDVLVGDTVYGKVEGGLHGLRFFKEPVPDGGGGYATSSTGSQSPGDKSKWQPESERDPERAARILRQHSQGLAVRVLGAMGSLASKDGPTLHRWIKDWADFFDKDVNAAGEAAKQAPGNSTPGGTSAASSPASVSPAPASQPAEVAVGLEAHRVDEALFNVGVSDGDERRWLNQAWEGLDAEKRGTALASLSMGDSSAAGGAVKRLREIAGPMPDDFREKDDIPFARPEYRPLFLERERWRF